MSSEPIPALTPIGPFDPGYKPVQEVTPFTYNDGFTYLQKLEVLAYYVNQRLVGSVNDIILAEAGFQTNVNSTISAFTDAQNAAMHALAASLIQWQVLDNADGTINYMMEDGSHITVYTVAGIASVLAAQDAKLNQFQVTLNGAIKDQNDAITAANTAQSAVIASNNAAQNVQIAKRQWTHMYDFVADFGADPTGNTPCDTAWTNAMNALFSANGGTLHFPVGIFKFINPAIIPYDDHNTNTWHPAIILQGSGMVDMNVGGQSVWRVPNGTVFSSTYQSDHDEQFQFNGVGEVHVRDIAFMNLTGNSVNTAMVGCQTSTIHMERCSFSGHPSVTGRGCNQDAIHLGSDDTQFVGYGSSIKNCTMDHIRTQMVLTHDVNSVLIENIYSTETCGAPDPIPAINMLNGKGAQITGNTIINYFIEGASYSYMFGMSGCYRNIFINPGAWDAWGPGQMVYMFNFDPNLSHHNTVFGCMCDADDMDARIWAPNAQASPVHSNTYIASNNVVASGIKSNYGGPLALIGGAAISAGGFYLPILANGDGVKAQRGSLFYNDTTRKLNFWDGSTWHEVTSG